MPFGPSGNFTLTQSFGTGTAPNNDFPPQVGNTLDDIASALSAGSSNNPYLVKSNNLSDLTSTATAVANLALTIGVFTQAFDAQLFSNIPRNTENSNYTIVATDAQKFLYKDDGNPYLWTIPANTVVPFTIGTAITFVNSGTAGSATIAIATDTLVLAGSGTTGTRVLAINGMATILKVNTTKWFITGSGLT
jgi:hypothetical protein